MRGGGWCVLCLFCLLLSRMLFTPPLSFMGPPPPLCSPSLPSLLSGSLLCWSLLSGAVVRRNRYYYCSRFASQSITRTVVFLFPFPFFFFFTGAERAWIASSRYIYTHIPICSVPGRNGVPAHASRVGWGGAGVGVCRVRLFFIFLLAARNKICSSSFFFFCVCVIRQNYH